MEISSPTILLGKNYFKLINNALLSNLFDKITPTRSTFNGNNSSAWRSDVIHVNGFDQRMEYGGLDCELGYRLNNLGIKSMQIRNRTTVLHLYHTRPYKNSKAIEINRQIRQATKRDKKMVVGQRAFANMLGGGKFPLSDGNLNRRIASITIDTTIQKPEPKLIQNGIKNTDGFNNICIQNRRMFPDIDTEEYHFP